MNIEQKNYHITIHSFSIISAISNVCVISYASIIVDIIAMSIMTMFITKIFYDSNPTNPSSKESKSKKFINKDNIKTILPPFFILEILKYIKKILQTGSKRAIGTTFSSYLPQKVLQAGSERAIKSTISKFFTKILFPKMIGKIINNGIKQTTKGAINNGIKQTTKGAINNGIKQTTKNTAIFSLPMFANDFLLFTDLIIPCILSIIFFEFAGWMLVRKYHRQKIKELFKQDEQLIFIGSYYSSKPIEHQSNKNKLIYKGYNLIQNLFQNRRTMISRK